MKINKTKSSGYHYMNELNIVVSNSFSNGLGDSLGRTAVASFCFPGDRVFLIEGIKSFFNAVYEPSGEFKIYVTRYPADLTYYLRGNSRDHVIKAMAALKEAGEHNYVKQFVKHRAKRPSIERGYTYEQKIWFKALYSDQWSWVYAIAKMPWMIIQLIINCIGLTLSWSWKTYKNPSEYREAFLKGFKTNKWTRFWYKTVMPTFANFYDAFAINAIHNRKARNVLCFINSLYFEKHNYVGKMLSGRSVEVPFEYIPSRKNRWSIRLDRHCNRDIRPYISDSVENNMELALLSYCTRMC